jgi:hypothetical protein
MAKRTGTKQMDQIATWYLLALSALVAMSMVVGLLKVPRKQRQKSSAGF